ncbi:MAG: hypothetical protein HZA78_00510 [Candidatus Schekmanbacteria bacterium]|nr:hypothetical protein [Candidatus Schekmanbacteria bacterium]
METKPLVLVADDEDFFRTPLAGALRFFGYEVEEARHGKEFYEKVDQLMRDKTPPSVLIVDNQMPNQQAEPDSQWCGFERVKEICNAWKGYDIGSRVLFLSRWGLVDLPDSYRDDAAKKFRLLENDRWLSVQTPFCVLKNKIEICSSLGGSYGHK